MTIENVQPRTPVPRRTYTISRDNPIAANQLSAYTVYDKSGKYALYRLKPTSADIDTIVLTEHPSTDIIANVEGEWIAKIFNVTFSIHDRKLGKWIDGTIRKDPKAYSYKYSVEWNSKHLHTKRGLFYNIMAVFNTQTEELLASSAYRDWFIRANTRFTLEVYSKYVPDIIYFLLFAINDHRVQENT